MGAFQTCRRPFRIKRMVKLPAASTLCREKALSRISSCSLIIAFLVLPIAIVPGVRAQSASGAQFLFAVEGGQNPAIATYSVDQTTGALTTPPGVSPILMRAIPAPAPSAVNPAGTFLFVPSQNSNARSCVSVFSIASNGAITELTASPFSADNATFPLGVAVSPDGQYLYTLSGSDLSPTTTHPLIEVYSIGLDGTLIPVSSYSLPQETYLFYLHPTGRWLYALGSGGTSTSSIEQFTIGPSGTLTDNGPNSLLPLSAPPRALAGDSAGKYLFAMHGQFAGPSTFFEALSINGGNGDFASAKVYSTTDSTSNPSYEAVDSTGSFLFSSYGNFSIVNGVLTLLQLNPSTGSYPPPLLLASPTGPFLFAAGENPSGYFLTSDMIGSDGTLTPAPGSPYTLPIGVFSLAVTGSAPVPTEPVLTLSANSTTFASISPGQTTAANIGLSSIGFSPLVIGNISVSGDASFSQTNDCPSSLAAGASCNVNLKWAPTSAGTFTGTLNISSNAPSAAVSLSGTTAPAVPQIFVSPSSLIFPSTIIAASSASQTFTVTNLAAATAPLQVTGVTIGGSNPNDFSQTNTCTAAIPIGGSCSITVTFTPLAAGGRSATVLVANNTPGNSPASNIVSGTGATAPMQYLLQTSAVGPGTIQQSPSGTTFDANTSITLTAVPNANSTFTSWSGVCNGSAITVCNFSLTANTTATATFTANPALSVPQGQQTGAAGSTFTFPINETGFTVPPTLTASCSIPKGSCSINGTTLVVTTTAAAAGAVPVNLPRGPLALLLGLGIVLLLAAGTRTRQVLRPALLIGGLILFAGCGSSGGSGTNLNTGTPAGTYMVTVQATSGSQSANTTVSVVVH